MTVRKATLADIPGLMQLINNFAARGIMLPRTEFEMAENIRDFTVSLDGDRHTGCGALHIYTTKAGEVRSLAVDTDYQKHGIGSVIVNALEDEADTFGLSTIFAFTYVPRFFEKLGYSVVDRGQLPLKAWKDCLRCPKFHACDEIAMLKPLRPSDGIPEPRQPRELIQLPAIAQPQMR